MLECLLSFGVPLLQERRDRLQAELPHRFHELHGCTEGFVTILDRDGTVRKSGSVGRATQSFERRVPYWVARERRWRVDRNVCSPGGPPMPSLLRNAVAVLAGVALGGAVNMSLVVLGPSIIAPPAGVDMTNAASLGASMHLFEPRHFVMPFLAHALGTLAGALLAYFIAATHRAAITYAIGAIFLCGGIAASFMIPAPAWFIALDLLAAYLPMSWLVLRIGAQVKQARANVVQRS